MITKNQVAELLEYSPESGAFTWRVRRGGLTVAGSKAGRPNTSGHLQICVLGKRYQAHRLAWLLVTGAFPVGEIDHINGDKTDNRFQNLRDIPKALNAQNIRKPNRTNQLGLLGVSPYKGKYRAQINIRGRKVALGVFVAKEDAYAAYLAAKRKHHQGNTL